LYLVGGNKGKRTIRIYRKLSQARLKRIETEQENQEKEKRKEEDGGVVLVDDDEHDEEKEDEEDEEIEFPHIFSYSFLKSYNEDFLKEKIKGDAVDTRGRKRARGDDPM
jgi:hypothetical protein